jgi:SAM-dependent methyltransferase
MSEAIHTPQPEADALMQEFRRTLPRQLMLRELVRALGKTEGKICLEIGLDDGVMSHQLRRMGGEWHTVILRPEALEPVHVLVQDRVHRIEGRSLPFENKTFDMIIVANTLERTSDDSAFIEECHRVLKAAGRMIIHTLNIKPGSPITPLRNILGRDYRTQGLVRPGYTESDLFHLLKHGFDVAYVRSYSRFFVQLVDIFTHTLRRKNTLERHVSAKRRISLFTSTLWWIAYQLDFLLFLTRGFCLVAAAKRRAWIPRKTPVLADGRSISEAVLTLGPR